MLLLFCRTRLQMELDSKESDIELLMSKNALNSSDTTSVHSGNDLDAGAGSGDELLGQCLCVRVTSLASVRLTLCVSLLARVYIIKCLHHIIISIYNRQRHDDIHKRFRTAD